MQKKSIDAMKEIAFVRGGKCISKEYHGSKISLEWQCSKGHIWTAKYPNIVNGTWCPKCCTKKPTKYTIDQVKQVALGMNGACLSEAYLKTTDQLSWRCDLGHIWQACFHEVNRGAWCPRCAWNNLRKYSIEDCQEIAAQKFGKCLSEKYIHKKHKLEWMCEKGHVWSADLGNVKDNDSWCPECSSSYGENKFREIIEQVTGKKFKKIRPIWLLNEKGNRMEIDGYNEEMKLGFEFQGRQHMEFVEYWHKHEVKYLEQIHRDEYKKKKLELLRIKILYPTSKLKPIEFETFVRQNIGQITS